MRFHFLIVPVALSLVACGTEHQAMQNPAETDSSLRRDYAGVLTMKHWRRSRNRRS